MPIYRLNNEPIFPSPELAEEDGLLAVGGDLTPNRLLNAYANGIYPWYDASTEILWWAPDPRLVLFPDELKVSDSLKRIVKAKKFDIRFDTSFDQVIEQCAKVSREGQDGTWITKEMQEAYIKLFHLGFAHSVEAFEKDILVGGLYGVAIGRIFYGESMFTIKSNASKVCLVKLVEKLESLKFEIIDCQQTTQHLQRMGAREISRSDFLKILNSAIRDYTEQNKWM